MNKQQFLSDIQARTARVAIMASTARGQGKGVVAASREFLCTLPLVDFGTRDPVKFRTALDRETLRFLKRLPRTGRHWGVARKFLNIFLRDALYNTYLCEAFRLERAEHSYEVPLDSIVAARMRETDQGRTLPRWHGVKYVTPPVSAVYQNVATAIAAEDRIARIHLDAKWWGGERNL